MVTLTRIPRDNIYIYIIPLTRIPQEYLGADAIKALQIVGCCENRKEGSGGFETVTRIRSFYSIKSIIWTCAYLDRRNSYKPYTNLYTSIRINIIYNVKYFLLATLKS